MDPYAGSLVVSSAGHPPPLITADDGEPAFIELPGSAPLGATRYPIYEDREHDVEPGSALVLYTDGLVERAGESLDDGLERLRRVVQAGPQDLEHLGDRMVAELLPGGAAEDDAALLVGRVLPLADELSPGCRLTWTRSRSCAACSGAGCTRPAPRGRTSRICRSQPRRRARTRSSTPTAGAGDPGGARHQGVEWCRACRRSRLRQLAAPARRQPRPRADAYGGPHGLRRGGSRRRRHYRAAVPTSRALRRHERQRGAGSP